MKNFNSKIFLSILIAAVFTMQLNAQKDTTELEIGKKKMIIVDKKAQKEKAIYNLEKGLEKFEKELQTVEEIIKKHEELLKDLEAHVKIKIEEAEGEEMVTDFDFEFNFDEMDEDALDSMKKELHKQFENYDFDEKDIEIIQEDAEKHKAMIEMHKKEKEAYEKGIYDIEEDLKEIEEGLADIDEELEYLDESDVKSEKKKHHKKRFNAHWAGFELGLLNFLNSSYYMATDNDVQFMRVIPEKSMSYGLNVIEYNIPISKYYFGLATGAGIEWNSLALSENVNLEKIDGEIVGVEETEYEFKKNKLNAAYITVPLIFELQIPIKKHKIYFGGGVTGGVRAWSKQKQKYIADGRKDKYKKVDDFYLSSFRYGLTARIGYGNLGFFVNYSMVPLFQGDRGPEMYPITMGIHLIDF